jgi:hypothetical protein
MKVLDILASHLGLSRQRVRAIDKVVQLLSTGKDGLDSFVLRVGQVSVHASKEVAVKTYQNDLCLIKLLLDLHNRVRLPWILILLDIGGDLGERYGRRVAILLHLYFPSEVLENFGQE